MNSSHEIIFSAAEVDKYAIFSRDPQKIYFMPKGHEKVENKTPYSEFLLKKVSSVIPNSSFSICDGFKKQGLKTRCYIKCGHKIKMPISYIQAELKESTGLKFTLKIVCPDCAKNLIPPATSEPIPVVPTPAVDELMPPMDVFVKTELEKFEKDLYAVIQNELATCSAAPDPKTLFEERKQKLKQDCLDVINKHLGDDIISPLMTAEDLSFVENNLIAITNEQEEREEEIEQQQQQHEKEQGEGIEEQGEDDGKQIEKIDPFKIMMSKRAQESMQNSIIAKKQRKQ